MRDLREEMIKEQQKEAEIEAHVEAFMVTLINAIEDRLVSILDEIRELKLDATRRYGTQNHNLGTKGLYVELDRKNQRLKRFLWDGQTTTSENLKDTLQDNAVYSILTIMQAELEGLIE